LAAVGVPGEEHVLLEVLGAQRVIEVLEVDILGRHRGEEAGIVVKEAGLRLVDHDGGGGVLRIDGHLAVTDSGAGDDLAGDVGEVTELIGGRGDEVEHFGPNGRVLGLGENAQLTIGTTGGLTDREMFFHEQDSPD